MSKYNHHNDYDYSDIHYDGDVKKLLEDMAKVIEEFASYMETYAIYSCSEEEWEENRKLIKKLIKKLKKGDPSCLDIDRMNEILDSGHSVLV